MIPLLFLSGVTKKKTMSDMMNSCDEDLFNISDEEVSASSSQFLRVSNPVENYLMKQLINIENKIETTCNDIEEVEATTGHILNVLQRRMLYGEDINSDDDNDLYTVEGEPIIKWIQEKEISNTENNLEIISQWQCVLHDKWIIGVRLQNKLQRTVKKLKYYPCMKDELEIRGESMFWQLQENRFWRKINTIHPGTSHVVATTVLDLPLFARESVVDCWGMISYEIDETRLQTLVPLVRLSAAEIIDCSWTKFLDEDKHGAILALKSTSNTEVVACVKLSSNRIDDWDKHDSERKRLFHFLAKKTFEEIHSDVFSVKEYSPLTHCLIEVLLIDIGIASLRISVRSSNQLHIIMHFLQDEFSHMTIEENIEDNCVEAAKALIRELELIRDKKSALEIQEAKLITDLLIP